MAKYLSDPIILKFKLPDTYTGRNVPYDVTDDRTGEVLYTGSIYVTGEYQTLYLNDIVCNLNDDYSWFLRRKEANLTNENDVEGLITNSPHQSKIYIRFDKNNDMIYTIPDIIHATKVPNRPDKYASAVNYDNIMSFNQWGTGVIPKIPKLTYTDPKFFLAMMVAYPQHVFQNNQLLRIALFDKHNMVSTDITTLGTWDIDEDGVTKYYMGRQTFYFLGRYFTNNPTLPYALPEKFWLGCYGDNMAPSDAAPICEIESDPAEYYVSWINRYGAWQCQPLCAKHEMKEKVTTSNIVTLTNETVPCDKTSEYTWQLNTHWLTYDEHDEFESLLTSKYVYLYNTKTNEGHYVTVTDSNWTFRDSVNTKKPFNLTLNLTKSMKQNIIY